MCFTMKVYHWSYSLFFLTPLCRSVSTMGIPLPSHQVRAGRSMAVVLNLGSHSGIIQMVPPYIQWIMTFPGDSNVQLRLRIMKNRDEFHCRASNFRFISFKWRTCFKNLDIESPLLNLLSQNLDFSHFLSWPTKLRTDLPLLFHWTQKQQPKEEYGFQICISQVLVPLTQHRA